MQANKKNKLTIIALALLFGLPVIAAVVLNSRWVDWQPGAAKNYGELIAPVLPLPADLREDVEEGHWQFVFVDDADACGSDCDNQWQKVLNMHKVLGRRSEYLNVTKASEVNPEYSGWLRRASANSGAYIIDPLGNLMMRYPQNMDVGKARKDLDRLLRYSKFYTDSESNNPS